MTFGQIEQSWFEDDLWSLHSIPPAPEQHKMIEANRHDRYLVETTEPVLTAPVLTAPVLTAPVRIDADVTDAPLPSAAVPTPVVGYGKPSFSDQQRQER